jgi:hypothetical protein
MAGGEKKLRSWMDASARRKRGEGGGARGAWVASSPHERLRIARATAVKLLVACRARYRCQAARGLSRALQLQAARGLSRALQLSSCWWPVARATAVKLPGATAEPASCCGAGPG